MSTAKNYGLYIAVPTLGRPVCLDWAFAFKSQVPPINFNTITGCVYGQEVGDARQILCEEALKNEAKYIYFIGDDTIPPAHSLRQLIFRMENNPNLGVVGGIYFTKTDPSFPLVFRGNGAGSYWDWKVGEYFAVSGIGMDCTLIRTEILHKLEKPWFKTIDTDRFLDAEQHAEMWTEDLYFCKKVSDLGYDIYADSTIIARHWDHKTNRYFSIPERSLLSRRLENNGKKILDIGCGELFREFDGVHPIRVDIREECKPDYRCDVRQLPFANDEFDTVFSSHVLEHFERAAHIPTLTEWIRVLKPGGKLWLILPNIQWAAEQIMSGNVDQHVLNVLYGAQSNPYDKHYNGFTPDTLKSTVEELGCKHTETELQGYNIIFSAEKLECQPG